MICTTPETEVDKESATAVTVTVFVFFAAFHPPSSFQVFPFFLSLFLEFPPLQLLRRRNIGSRCLGEGLLLGCELWDIDCSRKMSSQLKQLPREERAREGMSHSARFACDRK